MPKKIIKPKNTNSNKISPGILILDLTEKYPEVIDMMVNEYGFHCVGCYFSGFETLEEGANVHGIKGRDFEILLAKINKIVRKSKFKKT